VALERMDINQWWSALKAQELRQRHRIGHHIHRAMESEEDMMGITIEQVGEQIQAFFHEGIETVARETEFVQRTSKLTGTKFLQALVFHSLEKQEMTLSSISQSCLDLGVDISEQGINERIDETSVAFLSRIFEQASKRFRLDQRIGIELLEQFANIYLVDSTQISLPETMAELFPGSGGNASSASVKIQLVFDYLHGHLEQIELCSGKNPDQGYRGHWSIIRKAALFLMDLGYFALDTFKKISDHEAYFLSRLQMQTGLFDETGQRLELSSLLANQSNAIAETNVLIGSRSQHQIPCRLIMIRLPKEAADRQRQKARENAQRHGRTISRTHLKLLDWAIFITNVPAHMLRIDHVASLYRIRWQIELVFKMCKSFCGLTYIASLRPERIWTELYARLIGVVLTYFLLIPVRLPLGPRQNREISPTKLRLIFQRFARTLAVALNDADTFVSHIHEFFSHVAHFGFKQKRRKSPNALHALALISACYAWADDTFPTDGLLDPWFITA
jgi:hypothetical protein